MHRRQLPIVGSCPGFERASGSERGLGGFCERCRHEVHDVSSMTEGELSALMAAHVGRRVCVTYRVDARGYVHLRPEPRRVLRPVMLGALAMLMAACAGTLLESDSTGWVCRDPDGYQVTCVDWRDHRASTVPDALDEPEPAPGCPVRPTAEAFEEDEGLLEPNIPDGPGGPGGSSDPEDPGLADGPTAEVELDSEADVDPDAPGTNAKFRANFSIDPEGGHRILVGMVVGFDPLDPKTGRLRYRPTSELLEEWRDRRAERRATRERRRFVGRG